MSRRIVLMFALLTSGCASPPGQTAADPDGVDPDEVEPRQDFSESAYHEHVEPPPPPPAWRDPVEEEVQGAYLERQVLVAVDLDADLGMIAQRVGASAVDAVDDRGFASVWVPEGTDPNELLARLAADSRVHAASRMGVVVGDADGWAVPYQWHHERMDRLPTTDVEYPERIGEVTVAVLDTGVAYEDYIDEDGQVYAAASTLQDTEFVTPWDFVNDDAHANDDHQHGTHLASLIASEGAVVGVAPGVRIMPVKVLDHRKRGTELHLVRGIDHAVANGADVINLSLSFPPGYVPSPLLQRALQEAAEAGVVMVGAAGNDGVDEVTWPAASPHVIAVGAIDFADSLAPYSNVGGALEVVAPGGDLSADANGDGVPDGVLGETIALGDPERTGLWLMEGTSQATALTTGVVALRLAVNGDPDKLRPVLQQETRCCDFDPEDGRGAGPVSVTAAVDAWYAVENPVHYATLRPFLERLDDGRMRPGARIRVTGATGWPAALWEAYGTFAGTSRTPWSCFLDSSGSCTVFGEPVEADPTIEPIAWTVSVDGTTDWVRHIVVPRRAVLASDSLNVLAAALEANDATRDATLVFLDDAGENPILGRHLAESYVVFDLGSGLMSSPMGIVASPPALRPWLSPETVGLDVDGTGLMSSPMGFRTVTVGTLSPPSLEQVAADGSGLLSSPMLGFRPKLAVLGSSSGIGLGADALTEPGAAPELDVTDRTFSDELVRLDDGTVSGGSDDTALGARLAAGGWQQDGVAGPHAVLGSGQVSVAFQGSATAAEAVELAE